MRSGIGATTPCAIPGSPLADASAGIDACVHCGFCLQACPTYLVLEDENDSPRGRIVLMRALVEGTLPTNDTDVRTHTSTVASVAAPARPRVHLASRTVICWKRRARRSLPSGRIRSSRARFSSRLLGGR